MKQTIINLAHNLTHWLFAAICLMLFHVANNQQPLDIVSLSVCLLGALLPDLDTSTSFIGRLVPPLSKFLERKFGHRQEVHSIWVPAAVLGLHYLFPNPYSLPLAIGFASHLLLDTLNPEGVPFLLPLSNARITLLGGHIQRQQPSEAILLVGLAAATAATAAFTRFEPSEFVQNLLPTTDTAREQYRQWEGIYHIYADIEGTWNRTHQRYSGRVEMLGFDHGGAMLFMDPATGQRFTGGQHPVDDFYISKITLHKGERIDLSATPYPLLPTPTPIIVTILVENVRNPDLEILIRPGDIVTKGQLIAELLPTPYPLLPTPTPLVTVPPGHLVTESLGAQIALAELELARAEHKRALEGTAPSDAAILQAESAIAQIEASIASLQYLQAANPNLTYVPAQITAAQARLTAAQARLEEAKRWKGPSAGDVAVAQARLALAELRYQQAIATPTPRPTPTPYSLLPTRIYSLVNGLVRSVHVKSVVGNVATIEIAVELH